MLAHTRHQAIIDTLGKCPALSISELERLLGASPATVRRDLSFLEKIGKIVRTHGGVIRPDHARGELSFDRKSRSALDAKIAIAEAAAAIVSEGGTAFVDAGTTALEVGRRLLRRKNLTILTNSIPLLGEPPGDGVHLVSVGGEVRALSRALVGAGALGWLDRVNCDIAFLGASGVEPQNGPCTTELFEAEIKRAAASRARRVVLVADAAKWRQPASIRYADWPMIHDVITDVRLPKDIRTLLKKQGVRLHCTGK